jgi:Ca2+-binding RTX toxin-like protein
LNARGNLINADSGNDMVKSGAGIDRLLGGNGNDILNGGAGNDRDLMNYRSVHGTTIAAQFAGLFGEAGDDILNGGAGDDNLEGGMGRDRLIGGTGADRFTFNVSTEGGDIIVDFDASQGDWMAISASGFGGGLVAGTSITPAQITLGTVATTVNQRFIYNSATGLLRFDVDGTGSIAAVQIATFITKPTLANISIAVIA